MKDLPIVSLTAAGSDEHPRFTLTNQQNLVWNGECFTSDAKQALLYADLRTASREMQQVLLKHYRHKRRRFFIAPLLIELFADEDVSDGELIEWLSATTYLHMDTPTNGNGPKDGLVLLRIHWDGLR